MTNNHPITPPPELVEQWANHSASVHRENGTYEQHELAIATQAARWGSDQELEACVNYIDNNMSGNKAREFRAIRRPKPPSLKEQALTQVESFACSMETLGMDSDLIRRALEQLPN